MTSALEQYRLDRGMTYQELADLFGVSRQYAKKLCEQGSKAATKIFRVLYLTNGDLKLEDLISYEDRDELEEMGITVDRDTSVGYAGDEFLI